MTESPFSGIYKYTVFNFFLLKSNKLGKAFNINISPLGKEIAA